MLLSFLKDYLDQSSKYEFCLELNPEFITEEQIKIFKSNEINRVSIGVQSTDNKILNKLNRVHTIENVESAIELLYKYELYNISLDFIYALPDLTNDNIIDSINFIKKYQIPHISYYALEVKEGSILNYKNYKIDEDEEADQLIFIDKELKTLGFNRYEVSNWSINKKTESLHNKCYWLTNDWKGIGLGASGFEKRNLYKYSGTILDWKKDNELLSNKDYLLQRIMMGLRLTDGIDITNNIDNSNAYKLYFNDIVNCYIRDNKLRCKNINLLHETLVNIIDEVNLDKLEELKENLKK